MRISDWSSDVCSSDLVSVVIADRIVAADIHVEETARKKGRRPVAHQVGREGAGRKVTPRPAIGTDPVELVDAQIGVIIEIGLYPRPVAVRRRDAPPLFMGARNQEIAAAFGELGAPARAQFQSTEERSVGK